MNRSTPTASAGSNLALVLALGGLFSCTERGGAPLETFEVHGTVVRLEPERSSITLAHEEIPGVMQPMTMPFDVPVAGLLEGLKPDQEVVFQLRKQGDRFWIDAIRPAS